VSETTVATPVVGAVVAAAVVVLNAWRRWPKAERYAAVATPVFGTIIAAAFTVGRAWRTRTKADLQSADATILDANHPLIATKLGSAVAAIEETERSAGSITGRANTAAIDDAITRIWVAALPLRTGLRYAAERWIADLTGQTSGDRVDLALMGLRIAGLRDTGSVRAVSIETAFVPR
jgi:hypothetical protein